MPYTPRQGSKTEAAIEFIRDSGGFALCTAIREAVDVDLKNMFATFQAAVDHGVIERAEMPEGMGYRLCDSGQTPRETRAETMARELQVSQVIPSRKPPPTVLSMAKKPKLKTAKELGEGGGARRAAKKRPPTSPLSATFRCGRFMDGSIRLEGVNADMQFEAFDDVEKLAITVSPDAARQLVAFLTRK